MAVVSTKEGPRERPKSSMWQAARVVKQHGRPGHKSNESDEKKKARHAKWKEKEKERARLKKLAEEEMEAARAAELKERDDKLAEKDAELASAKQKAQLFEQGYKQVRQQTR